jgi:hypothetical protein
MSVVACAVGAVIALAAVLLGVGRGTATTLGQIAVLATVVAMVGVVVLLSRRAALEHALSEIRAAQSVVVAGEVEGPGGDVAILIDELQQLGFEMLGATDTLIGARSPIRTWVLTESRGLGATWVEVGSTRAAVAIFLSRAGDGRFLETVFPDGATIDHPNVLARPIETSVADALRGHRAVLSEWTLRAGPPLLVRTLQDYRRVEPELRERTGGLLIAAHLEQVVEPGLRHWATSAAIGLATVLGLVVLTAIRS